MGWIKTLLGRVAGVAPTDWTMVRGLEGPDLGLADDSIEPDKCYVEIYLESLRLSKARRFATTFDGVVYAFATLARDGAAPTEIAAVSTPQNLAGLSADGLKRVITVEKRLLGALPWRGNPLSLELGLFSVKSGNLITPLVEYVTKIADQAGVSSAKKVDPFLPFVSQGLDMIAGQTEDTAIELAIDTDMSISESIICALVAKPKGSLDTSKLSIDKSDRQLLEDGKPVDAGYCVFSVRARKDNPDWGAIKPLQDALEEFKAALIEGDEASAKAALGAFNRQVIVSPDLIEGDKDKLKSKARAWLDEAFPGAGVRSMPGSMAAKFNDRVLGDLDLYDTAQARG